MNWFSLAFLAAVAVSTKDAWIKRQFSALGPYEMALFPLSYSLPLFLVGLFLIERPPLDAVFWQCIMIGIPLEIAATLLYMESIRVSPLSLTIPYLALTPAFTLLTGRLLLHEMPNPIGIVGVLATVVGSYVLNLNPNDRRLIAPFVEMLKEKGCPLMLLVAVIYSMTSVLCRKAILHSSPLFFAMVYCLVLDVTMLLIITAAGKSDFKALTSFAGKGATAGLLFFIEVMFNNLALGATRVVAYMISVKRLSIIMGVAYGGVLFRERHLFYRFAGALVMAGGAIVISVWGG
jgi:drug/metabolite transporter (DMT)-like permease